MQGVKADELERACGLLGDTVLDPTIWPLAMDEICRAVGASGAMLLQGDIRTPDIPRTASFDEQTQCYFCGDWHIRDTRGLERLTDRLRTTCDTDVLPCEPIVVRRKRRAPVVIRVLPVHGAARTPFLGARALLTFASVEPRPGPKPSLLAKLFGLTPAEAKLASLMAEGISLEKAAEALEISRETARNQLKAVFAKTATHRQGELVALLSGL